MLTRTPDRHAKAGRHSRSSCWPLLLLAGLLTESRGAGDFDTFLKPFFAEKCTKCHGEKKVKGKVNLKEITTAKQFLGKPKLILDMIEAIDANEMPPEDEPELGENDRARLLVSLKAVLRESASAEKVKPVQIRRLNRFQYNNSIKDLFHLNRDVFQMREKLMTRQVNYLAGKPDKMPDKVEVACLSLQKSGGFGKVNPFPRDLRATHGFDNQANELTLSPLLLDTFLKLSVSILESPDFNEGTVGIWNDFFREPAGGADLQAEVRKRLEPFLMQAFRTAIDGETLDRYTAYTMSKLEQELSFTDSMKKAVSAVLSSPRFLFRYGATNDRQDLYLVASNMAFFLWGSGPDLELLRLAQSGEFSTLGVFNQTIDRMLADPRIERFLDSFPSQWMQLENVLAATPDPKQAKLFNLDKSHPASVQMVLEPLLLFDAVFIENRPIVELIAPPFSYQSEFLKTWYSTDLMPKPIDEKQVAEENRAREQRRKTLEATIGTTRAKLDGLNKRTDFYIEKKSAKIDVASGQAKWEAAQAQLVAESVVLSKWYRIGPFGAGNFDEAHAKAFLDETAVDLRKAHGNLKWEEAKDLVDGKIHMLSGPNSATYLYRVLRTESARPLELSLGSDDSFKLWLNGKLVAEKKQIRGVAPDQDKVRVELANGDNKLLLKVANGVGGYAFYFKAQQVPLPGPLVAALKVQRTRRTKAQNDTVARHYRAIAPELEPVRREVAARKTELSNTIKQLEGELNGLPGPQDLVKLREEAQRKFEDEMRNKMRLQTFERVALSDPRYGGVITNAAMMSMTSGPKRTHPIARGAWIIEVIFNNPPPPPPNDVPPLNEDSGAKNQTIREKFAQHRKNPNCAGCHSRLDPLGFALENYDIVGRWRDKYENGRDVDASGTLLKKYDFDGAVRFKENLLKEERRFAKAFTAHLLRFATSKELSSADLLTIEDIVDKTEKEGFKIKSLIREVILSESFVRSN